LPPSGKFSRFALAAALLLPLLLILNLEFVSSPAAKLLLSNSLDFAMVLLASFCSLHVARRASGYPRQIWFLLSAAFALESLAQAVSAYYQSFVPAAIQIPWPSDILYFVWAAPVFMIFLPRPDDDSSGIDSLRLLDFLQVAILALTLYLYFFYSPSRWQSNSPPLLPQLLILYIARDLLLSISFLVRSRRALPSWQRSFSLFLSLVFFTAVLSDAEYLFTLGPPGDAASWGDLLWMLPCFILILFAVNWKQPVSASLSAPPVARLVSTQVLLVLIPLLVIFMGRAIAREQPFLAWLAVTASVLCSSIRLLLNNRRQRLLAEHLLNTEKALRHSEQLLSTAFRNSPDAFSISLFPDGPYIELNDGFTRLTGYPREEVLHKTPRQLNLWLDLDLRATALATLSQTGQLRNFEFRFRTKDGKILIGQMYASLIDLDGQRCSLVVVRDITQRKEAEEILRSSEEQFRLLVRDLQFAVVLQGPDARIEFANRAAHRLFGVPEGSAVGKLGSDLGIFVVDEDGKEIPFSDRPTPVVLRSGVPLRDLLVGFRRAGSDSILWTFGNVVPQLDANGNIIRVISSFADVTALKNAERAIHQLSTQLLKLQDEERRRIGRELHDGLAQTVLAINLSLAQVRQSLASHEHAAARSLERARDLTQQMSREIRTLSYLLHPPLLDDLGLASALREYSQGFSERSGIATQLIASAGFERLPQPLELALFRIVQESLTNIQRHSGSSTAQIHLRQQDTQITLEIIDFGHGINSCPFPNDIRDGTAGTPSLNSTWEGTAGTHSLNSTREGTASAVPKNPQNQGVLTPEVSRPQPAPRLGVGIPGMRERMAQLGGVLDITSGPTGTTVRATISLPELSSPVTDDDRSSYPHRG
jgi:PAS domain S-box-containing protein